MIESFAKTPEHLLIQYRTYLIMKIGLVSLSIALLLSLSASCSHSGKVTDGAVNEVAAADGTSENTDSDTAISELPAPIAGQAFDSADDAIKFMRSSAHWNEYSAGILPQMASEVLEYASRLLNSPYSRFIIVDKARMKVILFDRYGRTEKTYGMACAKNYGTKHKRADSRTPEGFFSVEGIYDSTDWLFTDDDGKTSDKKGQFGPRFIRIKAPQTSQIGIHGTCAPWSIGSRSSHGCIRITNEQILELVRYVEIGMPVIISPGTRDMAVNRCEGYDIPSVTTRVGGRRVEAPEHTGENSDDNKVLHMPNDTVMSQPAPAVPDSITAIADTIP